MNIKIYTYYINIFLFTIFFFFWSNIPSDSLWSVIKNERLEFLFTFKTMSKPPFITNAFSKYRPSYLILILLQTQQ